MSALVVWLHGSGGCEADFASVLRLLMRHDDNNRTAGTMHDVTHDTISEDHPAAHSAHLSCVVPSLPIHASPADILAAIVDAMPARLPPNTPVYIVAHSYGCSIARLLIDHLHENNLRVRAILLLSPLWSISLPKLTFALLTPSFLLDFLRSFDRVGGVHSRSVRRVCGSAASLAIRQHQLLRNQHVQSQTLKNIAYYLLRSSLWYRDLLYGRELVEHLSDMTEVLVVTGDEDQLTPLDECAYDALKSKVQFISLPKTGHMVTLEQPELVYHALMTLVNHDTPNVVEEKWNLKNYTKWIATPPFSHAISVKSNEYEGERILYGMKVIRQCDLTHSPETLHHQTPKIGLVVDISKDTPPYDTSLVPYQKVATVSKIPPSEENVHAFITVLDTFWENSTDAVAVHCHYGFNRTGFMICCYLIERMGMSADEAIDAWREARWPGIKHVYFCEELRRRYCGLEKKNE